MVAVSDVLDDLGAESDVLDDLVRGLAAGAWRQSTPAPHWTVADQIGHLAWTDEIAELAVRDPEAFADALRSAAGHGVSYVDDMAAQRASEDPFVLLDSWRSGRDSLQSALRAVPDGTRIPWFGPPMSAMSMATARLMETWAHGQDVADALGVVRAPTGRLRHVAHIGVRTRDFAYALTDRVPPTAPFRIELVGPDGDLWAWGPADTTDTVAGPALDFCLLVTQRRHRDDLGLVANGEADRWLDFAQAFAGPPGAGRAARA